MFGLNPAVLYLIAGLVFTNLLAGAGWWASSVHADREEARADKCQTQFDTFKTQVETLGKQQEEKVAEVIAAAETITKETESHYETRLAAMRADYDRMRQQYTRAGSGAVSAVPVAAARVDEIPADALPLAEQCAETTLMLVSLQEWIDRQKDTAR